MSNKIKRWTKEEEDLFGKGFTNEQIMEKTKRSFSSVINRRSVLTNRENNGRDDEFTTQEKRIILTTPSNKEAAEKIGATIDSVVEMRAWLGQGEEPQVRMAAKAKVPKVYNTEELEEINEEVFSNKLFVKFGDSTMILNKDEVSTIQIGDGGIMILR